MKIGIPNVSGSLMAPDRFARNGSVPDALAMRQLAASINVVLGRRMKVLWSRSSSLITTPFSAAGSTNLWRGLFRTSPNPKAVKVKMVLMGAANTGTSHYLRWTVGGVAQTSLNVAVDTATLTPNGLRYLEQTFVDGSGENLAGNTQYEFSLAINDGARILGATIYEVVRGVLDTATHVAVPTDPISVGGVIQARELQNLHNHAYTAWKQCGPVHVRWANDDATPPTRTGSTYANVIDGSTTGYASTAVGQWHFTDEHTRYNATTLPCVFWAYASVNAGTGGRVRFTDSGGTMATITGITTTPQIWTTTASITGRDSLVVIEHSDSGANTITTHAAGFYEYTA